MHRLDEAGQHGHDSPGKKDSGNPDARSDPVQEQIARNFKEEVAEKENAEDESKRLAADGQLLVHRQRRKADVVAIDERDNEKQEDEGENPEAYFLNGSGAGRRRERGCFNVHNHLGVKLPGQTVSWAALLTSSRGRLHESMRRT